MPSQRAVPTAAPVIAPAPTFAQNTHTSDALDTSQFDSQSITLAGQVGGWTKALVVQGRYAYVGIGTRLVILDISTPAHPIKVGQTNVLSTIVTGVVVANNYAYVITDDLHVFDVSNIAKPVEIGFFDMPMHAVGIATAGKYVYVTEWMNFGGGSVSSDTYILDVSDPTLPTKVSQFIGGGTPVITVANNYIYIFIYSGLVIIDISDPTAPTQVGLFPGQNISNVVVAGNYAYLAVDSSFRIIDISDPTNPVQVGVSSGIGVTGIAISGGYAYLTSSDYSTGLSIYNISDPTNPIQVSFYSTDAAQLIAVSGSYAYIGSDKLSGLYSISIANPNAPNEVGVYKSFNYANKVVTIGDYAFVTTEYDGVHIIDIANSPTVREVGHIPGKSLEVSVDMPYIYIASDNNGLRIFNIENLNNPVLVSTVPVIAGDIVVGGSRAYMTSEIGPTRVLDISNPNMPLEIGNLFVSGDSKKVIKGNYLYILDGSNGLRIFDASGVGVPIEVGSVPIPANDIAVIGSYAYLASVSDGLHVIDITDPTSPTEVNSFPYDVGIVAGDERYLYAIKGSDRSQYVAYDISIPTVPKQVGTYSGFGLTMDLAGISDRMFVTDPYNGLAIFQLTSSLWGRITNPNNNPLAGVAVSISSGASTLTDASGYYTFTGILSGTYSLTPSLSGYTFAPSVSPQLSVPPSRTQNFTAMPISTPSYSISGRVTDANNDPISRVVISSVSAGLMHTTTTDLEGNYTLSGLSTGTYTITASRGGFTFLDSPRTINLLSNLTKQNFLVENVSPLIFIPGIMGSRLRQSGNSHDSWLGGFLTSHDDLSLDPTILQPNIIATDAIRTAVSQPFYQPLIGALTDSNEGNYVEYQVNDDPNRRTINGCDTSQHRADPTLFVFAYDWRKDNAENAQLLKDYIGCIHRLYPSSLYPNSKIDILTHSMGGLVARRYILDNADHHVGKLITIAAPWLGAPRATSILETGSYDLEVNAVLPPWYLKPLAEFFPGAHQLLPSRSYLDIGGLPFNEAGWDINDDGLVNGLYTYDQFIHMLNYLHPRSLPGAKNVLFHDYPPFAPTTGQDDWRSDRSGVQYYHIYGVKSEFDTVGTVTADQKTVCGEFLLLQCTSLKFWVFRTCRERA